MTDRNYYYGGRPDYYSNSYSYGNAYFPHHHYHDQYNAPPHRDNEHSEHQHQQSHNHTFSYGHNHQHDDHNHHNSFAGRNRH